MIYHSILRQVFCCLLMVLLHSGYAFGSDSLKGIVCDSNTGQPIVGAAIKIDKLSKHVFTNSRGEFEFADLDIGSHKLTCSVLGYSRHFETVAMSGSDSTVIEIFLKPEIIPAENLTITATRFGEARFELPLNISLTTNRIMAERSQSSTADLIREEPGVLVQKTTHGHGSPIIRGLIGKYVLLLYDGIRLNKPTFRFGANQYLNTISAGSFDRIEIVRGPSSVMYGSDAIGGVINMIPESSIGIKPKLSISPEFVTRYSSADNGKAANLILDGHYNGYYAAIGVGLKDIDDISGGGNIGKQSPTGWDELSSSIRLAYELNNKTTISGTYLGVRQSDVPRFDKYTSGQFERYIYDPQNRDLYSITLNSRAIGSGFNVLKINFSYQDEEEGRTEQKTGSSQETHSLDRLSTIGGFAQLMAKPIARHWLSFGGEYYRDKVDSERRLTTDANDTPIRPTYPDNTYYHSAGLFFQDDFQVTDNLSIISGLRYSWFKIYSPLGLPYGAFEESYSNLTAALGFSFRPAAGLNILSRWSRGFRAPNLNDTVVLKYSSSGVDAPSYNLKPEISNSFETGVKIYNNLYTGSLFIYYNNLSDLIDRQPGLYNGLPYYDENGNNTQDENEFDIFQKYNVDNAAIYGIEYECKVKLSEHYLTRFNCFWTRGENLTDKEPMSRIPPLMGLGAIRYIANDQLWYEFYFRLASAQKRLSSRDIDDTRIEPGGTPGWYTLNLRTQIKFRNYALTILLENLNNRAYKEHGSGVYSPGRNLVLSFSYSPE